MIIGSVLHIHTFAATPAIALAADTTIKIVDMGDTPAHAECTIESSDHAVMLAGEFVIMTAIYDLPAALTDLDALPRLTRLDLGPYKIGNWVQ